jgi:hypothetical protein
MTQSPGYTVEKREIRETGMCTNVFQKYLYWIIPPLYLLDDFQDKSQRANTPFSRQITTATANELLEDTLPYPWLANEFC